MFCDVVAMVVVLETTAPLEFVTVVVVAPSAAVVTVVVSPDEEVVVVVVVEDTPATAEDKLEAAAVLLVLAGAEPELATEFNAASALETPLIPLMDIA